MKTTLGLLIVMSNVNPVRALIAAGVAAVATIGVYVIRHTINQ
ncbi:MAG: hypothetical protein PHW34_00760 [Hespellia sp.]|nr:hypothetical protein [Hespellia sp.]